MSTAADPRGLCLVGVAQRTWHPDEVGDDGAPEPLAMWEEVARAAAADVGARGGAGAVLGAVDGLDVVYCQSWPYDDPPARLAAALGIDPDRRRYTGIGGTTPLALVHEAAGRMAAGELDVALVCSGEALATKRRLKKQDRRPPWSHREAERSPFPFEAPFHPAEVAHEVFQAWLTFATFDVARRAHRGLSPDEHRRGLGELFAPLTEVAASEPDAWFPVARSADELATPTAENRMVGFPYTKRLVSVMDVDMAAAVVLATTEAADRLGVPADRRVHLRGGAYAEDPTYVAEHPEPWRSPAMAWAFATALGEADAGIDDVAHLDLYSCFPSSVAFALDALGLDAGDARPLTVTGGLPYFGGPGSGYGTHALVAMARRLREDPGSFGLLSAVGMHLTKHAATVLSTEPAPTGGGGAPGPLAASVGPEPEVVQIVDRATGPATVSSYSVVHDRDGEPAWGLLVRDLPDGGRAYAKALDPDFLVALEAEEWVGRGVDLTEGEGAANLAVP